jgi:hypothetical protein
MINEICICGKPITGGVNYSQPLTFNTKTKLWEGIDEKDEIVTYTEEEINNIEQGLRDTLVYIYYIVN